MKGVFRVFLTWALFLLSLWLQLLKILDFLFKKVGKT